MANARAGLFPADFVWGAATAAYQIEGGVAEDGRGESIWDRFCGTPGKVRNGDSGAVACDFYHRYPEDEREEDVAAALHLDGVDNRWFLDPVFRGAYPEDVLAALGDGDPPVRDGDLDALAAPIDFLGVNSYTHTLVAAGPTIVPKPTAARTEMGWEVYPQGLYGLLVRLRDEYGPSSISITENGAAFGDVRLHDGSVRDPERQAYVAAHVEAVGRAVREGVPVRRYFVWSLLDNFEWAHGFSKRFGLVYVDYPTLERVPKSSFSWYRETTRPPRRGRRRRRRRLRRAAPSGAASPEPEAGGRARA